VTTPVLDAIDLEKPPAPRRGRIRDALNLNGISLRARVSLLVMVAVGITVAVVSIISYSLIRSHITEQLDRNLFAQANFAATTPLATDPGSMGVDGNVAYTLAASGVQAALVEANGQTVEPQLFRILVNGHQELFSAVAPFGPPEIAVAAGTSTSSVRTVTTSAGEYRVVAVRIPNVPDVAFVLAESTATTETTLHMLGIVSTLVGLAGIALAGIAGLAIGRSAVRPVERLTVATEYIARTGDLRNIDVVGKDELARLSTSFNTMLGALARSQDHQRRLVADAGHELRTPLTSIRTNLDLLAQATAQEAAEPDAPRLSAQDRAEMMGDVRAQMEEMSVLISDLVELSRDEHPAQAVDQVDFAEIVHRAVERVQRRAPGLHFSIDLNPWYLDGEPAALERAVTNLLDNAAKWSPAGGTVTVSLDDGALQVADQGPGIAEEDLAHVFERFYRSPEARTMPGSGLGLAIVRQVAENHGGRVAAARAHGGGALLGLWLPGSPGETARLPERAGPAAASTVSPDA
jgi:two-component system, OmpR family, sensor histidine kinase MprB